MSEDAIFGFSMYFDGLLKEAKKNALNFAAKPMRCYMEAAISDTLIKEAIASVKKAGMSLEDLQTVIADYYNGNDLPILDELEG